MPDSFAPRLTGRSDLCYQRNRYFGSFACVMPRVAIGDCHLYYERHGAGFPILLISGLGGHAYDWRDQIPVFAKHFDVVLHDQRGVGQSAHCRMSYTIERMAADVLELMDALGLERAHVVGHSIGAAIAQVMALEHPERLATVVLAAGWTRSDPYFRRVFGLRREILTRVGPAAYLQSSSLFLYPAWWVARNNEVLQQREAQSLATFPAAEIVASRIDAVLAFDRSADLRRIRTPCLVVGCEEDMVTPAYFSEELARLIPGAEVKMFPRGGHHFPQTMAREFNLAVLPFLKAYSPAE